MFSISIKDGSTGKVVANLIADRYLCLAQQGTQFTKVFSSPDLILQLGMLEFAEAQVRADVEALASPPAMPSALEGGEQ